MKSLFESLSMVLKSSKKYDPRPWKSEKFHSFADDSLQVEVNANLRVANKKQ